MMNSPLPKDEALLQQILTSCEASRLLETKQFMQHGDTNVYDHCVAVAKVSCVLVDKMGLSVDRESLIRGALLHDYFFTTGMFRTTDTVCMGSRIRSVLCRMRLMILP